MKGLKSIIVSIFFAMVIMPTALILVSCNLNPPLTSAIIFVINDVQLSKKYKFERGTILSAEEIDELYTEPRAGYDLDGWYTDKYLTERLTGNVTLDHDIKLYASSTPQDFTITFNTDGGSSIDSITQKCGTSITAPQEPTKTGYDFAGWSVDIPDTMPAENLEITALWQAHEHTITFVLDNGEDDVVITDDYGAEITAPTPIKTGYSFTWSENVPETMPDADLTITATWTINKHTLTFALDNGNDPIVYENVEYGAEITVPSNPSKTGNTFAGWNADIPETMPDEDLTITATWTPNKHTLTFVLDNGSEPIITENVEYGAAVTYPETPEKEGYEFNNWDQLDISTMPDWDLTITATWTVQQFTIDFNTSGGQILPAITADFGSQITAPSNPTKTGYIFSAWDIPIPETMPAQNITITAMWTPIAYTIAFDANKPATAQAGFNITGETASMEAHYDIAQQLTANGFVLTAYSFVGWTISADGTGRVYNNQESVSNLAQVDGATVTLHAQWKPTEYTITLQQTSGNSTMKYTIEDDAFTIADPSSAPEGQHFTGWLVVDATGNWTNNVIITNTDQITGKYGNVTLIAQYEND